MSPDRLAVQKTYKLTIGGKFPRSESGRTRAVDDADGQFLANIPMASRKDARDAVVAARKAFGGWSGATAYNRGQVLYRIAEMLEGRTDQFVAELVGHGASEEEARDEVRAAVDRWVWYAGWTDKIDIIAGSSNPVAGPYFNVSSPEPTGVVAAIAPDAPGLLGLVDVVAPMLVTGNTVVVLASRSHPLPALSFGEVVTTSDLPGGVLNILTADVAEVAPHLAAHLDVNAIDLAGAPADLIVKLEVAAADNVKRVRRPGRDDATPSRILDFTELKTVWHPAGR